MATMPQAASSTRLNAEWSTTALSPVTATTPSTAPVDSGNRLAQETAVSTVAASQVRFSIHWPASATAVSPASTDNRSTSGCSGVIHWLSTNSIANTASATT